MDRVSEILYLYEDDVESFADGGTPQLVQPSVDGSRPGYRGDDKLKTPYDYKYSGVFEIKTGENKGKYTYEVRNPNYTGKGSSEKNKLIGHNNPPKEPAKIKIGPFDDKADAIKSFKERQITAKELKLAGPQAKIDKQTKAINNFVTDFYEKNLNNFELRDYQSFEKKLIEEFKKSGIEDLGSGRKALNFNLPNVGKHSGKAKKKASKSPLTLYGMDARTPSGLTLQTDAQSFFKKAFYSAKLEKNPELVGKLKRYLEYYNTDRSKGKYFALKAKYADVLDPKVSSDLIYLLESDQIGTGRLRSSVIKKYLPDEYRKYVDKKNASGVGYKKLMKKIENSLTKKQLEQALNGETSITKFMKNQTDLLNEIFDTSELKKAGYSELIFNADHLEGMSEIARMDNAEDKIRALKNLVGTTSEVNRELGLEGFSSRRKSLMQKIKDGTNVEDNIDELNKITKASYPQFEGDLYKYNPATKTAVPTKNFIFNYDPETAFRQYFNELVKHPVGSEILIKQYVDKPELQKVIEKDSKLKSFIEKTLSPQQQQLIKNQWCPDSFNKGGGVGTCPIGEAMDNMIKKTNDVKRGAVKGAEATRIANKASKVARFGTGAGLAKVLGPYGIAAEALFEVAFAVPGYARGETGKRLLGDSLLGLIPGVGQSAEEEFAEYATKAGMSELEQQRIKDANRFLELNDALPLAYENIGKGGRGDPLKGSKHFAKLYEEYSPLYDQLVGGPPSESVSTILAEQDRINQQIAEDKAERAEKRSIAGEEDFMAAGGGIASIRRPGAIPPESGPQPQGLENLKYYVTNT